MISIDEVVKINTWINSQLLNGSGSSNSSEDDQNNVYLTDAFGNVLTDGLRVALIN